VKTVSWLKDGSGYTINDLVYYSGLFFGIIVVFSIGRPYGFHPILNLVVGIVVGALLGYVLERLYRTAKRDGDSGRDAEDRR
jgi:hypothetical protein